MLTEIIISGVASGILGIFIGRKTKNPPKTTETKIEQCRHNYFSYYGRCYSISDDRCNRLYCTEHCKHKDYCNGECINDYVKLLHG